MRGPRDNPEWRRDPWHPKSGAIREVGVRRGRADEGQSGEHRGGEPGVDQGRSRGDDQRESGGQDPLPDGPDGPAAARGQGHGERRVGRTTGSPSPTATDRAEAGGWSPPAKGDGRPVPQVTESEAGPQGAGSQSGGDDRTRVLTRLEGQIDGMLFEIKVAGGLPEFEEALRRARRILARSYGE